MSIYRGGWQLMWKHERQRLQGWGVPQFYAKHNQPGGKMPATPAEYRKSHLSGYRLALVLEAICDSGKVSKFQMKQLRKTTSFLYQLATGKVSENFRQVAEVWKGFSLDDDCADPVLSILPTRIPTPVDLKKIFTTPWRRECGIPLMVWFAKQLFCWDSWVCGARPGSMLPMLP